MKINDIKEGLRDPKDNPCWKGYKPVGTKKKGGRTVPNCVPKESVTNLSVRKNLGERIPIGPGVSPEQTQAAIDAKQRMSQQLSQQAQSATAKPQGPIDYSKEGPKTKSSMGHDLEYGIPVNGRGEFMNPNRLSNYEELGDEEYSAMITAYKTWLKDFLRRWPNASQNPDGTWSKVRPGLAPMYPKESVAEAKKKPNATTRHLKDYPVSDKDVAKPVKKPEKKKPEQSVAEGKMDSLLDRWMNSEYAPLDDESGDDNALFKKAIYFASDVLDGRSDSEALAWKLVDKFNGMDDEDDVDEGRFGRSSYYNPMDQERREQDAMDYERRAFKRAELQHELGHEDDPDFERNFRQQQIDKDRGPWYIRINGKIYRQRGEPKSFDWKRGANNYALAMVKNKPELQGKVMLTKRPEDDQPTIDESKNTVKVPVTQKPRQGPLRPQTGGGAHRDKKKEQKQGKEKHRKPFAESNYTADEMVDILSGKKTQAQVDAEKKSKQPTATPAPTQQPKPKVPEKSVKEAGELKVQKDDDKATVLLNPATGVQTQIDKTNPNAPRLSQDETGKLKLSAPQPGGGDQEKPNLVGKDVTVDQAPVEAVSRIGVSPEQPDGEITDVNPRSTITGDEDHDEISKLLNQRLRKLAGL